MCVCVCVGGCVRGGGVGVCVCTIECDTTHVVIILCVRYDIVVRTIA